jgi:hypothetical protein
MSSSSEEKQQVVTREALTAADPAGDLTQRVDKFVWDHLPLTSEQKQEFKRHLLASLAAEAPNVCSVSSAQL